MSADNQTVLLVEADKSEIRFFQDAFQAASVINPLIVLETGRQAIDYLAGAGQYADRVRYPFPCLALLELELPLVSGFDVLHWLRQQPDLRTLLVIALTSSPVAADVDAAYRLGARSVLIKPASLESRQQMVVALKLYWLEFNEFSSLGGCNVTEASQDKTT